MQYNVDKIIQIQMDNRPINCYITTDGIYYIGDEITYFLSAKNDTIPITLSLLAGHKEREIIGYQLEDVINNIKPRFLKYLAQIGLTRLIETGNAPEEISLSEFDQALLKVLRYRPNKD